MKQILFFLFFVATIVALCPPSFAARQNVVGAVSTAVNASGTTEGVDMTGQGGGGTLTVGTVGGPQTDIYTNNSSGGSVVNSLLFAVTTDVASQSNITFKSSSNVYGTIGSGAKFLNITEGGTSATVNLFGAVNGTTFNVGTGTVNFKSGSTNTTATNFTSDGTIGLDTNTTVIGALTTTAGANTGTLNLGGGSKLDGAVGGAIGLKAINVVGGSNTAGVTATITGATNAYNFSLGTNTLNIDGALTIANLTTSGVINTTLASTSLYGNIRPVGATNLGASLAVKVTVPSTADISVGTQFNIVQTRTGTLQSGTDGSVLTVTVQNPTNPLYTFEPVPVAGTIAGLVAIKTTGIPLQVPIAPPVGVTLPPSAPIAAPAAQALQDAPTTSDISIVRAAINAFSVAADVVNAETQLSPLSPALAAALVTFQGTREFQNLWLSHLDDFICSQVSSRQSDEENSKCRANNPRSGWWLEGFGYSGRQDDKEAFAGYKSKILGAMIAYDAPLSSDTRVGLGVGYARSTIDGKTFDTNTDFNTYQATAYIGHERGPWFVNGDVSFGWNDYSGMRHISYTGVDRTANAEYSGQDYTAFTNTGYHFSAQKFTITPLASLQYTHINLDEYTETGAGDISLKVNSQGYNFIESGLGVKVARSFSYRDGAAVPDIHFKWLHELYNPTMKQTAAYTVAGASQFTTPGYKTDDDTLNLGVGLTVLSCTCRATKWSLEAVYDYYWRNDNYSADQGTIRFIGRF